MNKLPLILGKSILALSLVSFALPAAAGDRDRPKYEKLEEGPVYLRLERIMVPMIHGNDVEKLITFILVVEFSDAASREQAKTVMPRLMDAFRRDLHVLLSRPSSAEELDYNLFKRYLLASGKRVLGAESVKDVLIERTLARKTG
jgi:hypothetical protein